VFAERGRETIGCEDYCRERERERGREGSKRTQNKLKLQERKVLTKLM
jgi:hypothetical protein